MPATIQEYRSYFRKSDGRTRGTQIYDFKDDTARAEKLRSRSQMIMSIVLVSVLCALIGLIIMFADTTGHPSIDLFGQVCWAIAIIAAAVGLFG